MILIAAEEERAVRRSRVRLEVLLALARVRVAYPAQLAALTGTDERRVRWAMHGHLPQYRPELGLVTLGLARMEAGVSGAVYLVTPRGRRKALEWSRAARVEPPRARGAAPLAAVIEPALTLAE